jgi:hypothetical protein
MQIIFEFDTPHGVFRDALYFYDDVIPSDAEIEAMKQQRLDNWLAIVNAPPEAPIEEAPVEEAPVEEIPVQE